MSHYRNSLPQLNGTPFITDGGIETTLIFDMGFELPEFAAFIVLSDEAGRKKLEDYYLPYIKLAVKQKLGFILESPTYRASRDWGQKLGYSTEDLHRFNDAAIAFMADLRNRYESGQSPMPISGCIGPRGDGYHIDVKQSVDEAREYHRQQITTFAASEADLVSAFTLNYVEEAAGIALAARDCNIPSVISFTVETDGRLPSGQPLGSAIEEVDHLTGNGPAYYMINCAHPTHFARVLDNGGAWIDRIHAVRANASCKSHDELEQMKELDRGDTRELAKDCTELRTSLPNLTVFGGCCGTDHHHMEEICHKLAA